MLPVRIGWKRAEGTDPRLLLGREWLVTNGLSGYASGTIAGACTRRYHGLLIAALPEPDGRVMMFNHLSEQVRLPGGDAFLLGAEEAAGRLALFGAEHLEEFRLEAGLPVWRYRLGDFVIEKRLFLVHAQNTVHVIYTRIEGAGVVRLKLRPAVHFRPHDAPVSAPVPAPYALSAAAGRYEIAAPRLPPLRLALGGARPAFTLEGRVLEQLVYRVEESRGYDAEGPLWSPGYFRADLGDEPVTLSASTEPWEAIEALPPRQALESELVRRRALIEKAAVSSPALAEGAGAELVLAADQFVFRPVGRLEDAVRARADGEELRAVIAGYHWFTDWGRDTMISLEGLLLRTGRADEARMVLRAFALWLRDGLVPNLFPEGSKEGLYHTADATLWFAHAVDRYLIATGDAVSARALLPRLEEIVERHLSGTRFGIGVDPADGLLRQGAPGYALTWMDANVEGWVVTPRRGKAVEINALWYNALVVIGRLVAAERGGAAARRIEAEAARVREAFNRRFWYAEGRHLYDVVDAEGGGDDPALRPNQLFAISLPNPVLERERWPAVLEAVERELVTPVGLRSLARAHPDYKASYHGDVRTRDAAYHQGTVWSWLVGPYFDAARALDPRRMERVAPVLRGLVEHLGEACVGSVSEVFDAEPPFAPRGCVAQAWGVAELLRCLAAAAATTRAEQPSGR